MQIGLAVCGKCLGCRQGHNAVGRRKDVISFFLCAGCKAHTQFGNQDSMSLLTKARLCKGFEHAGTPQEKPHTFGTEQCILSSGCCNVHLMETNLLAELKKKWLIIMELKAGMNPRQHVRLWWDFWWFSKGNCRCTEGNNPFPCRLFSWFKSLVLHNTLIHTPEWLFAPNRFIQFYDTDFNGKFCEIIAGTLHRTKSP